MEVGFSYTFPHHFSSLTEDIPVFYSEKYARFLQSQQQDVIYFYSAERRMIVMAKVFRARFVKLLQFQSAPVKAGEILSPGEENEFNEALIKLISRNSLADRIVQPANHCLFLSVPAGSVSCGFGTYRLPLQGRDEDELFAALHSKHRNVIRNAIRSNVTVKFGPDQLETFYQLYSQTMQRNSMYLDPIGFFREYLRHLRDNVICGVSYAGDVPQGALLVPVNKYAAWYVYGASADNVEVTGAVNLLHWELIKKLAGMGVMQYDFVGARLSDVTGSRLEGIQKFKSRFGSQLHKGYLWKLDINSAKCRAFDSLVRLKARFSGSRPPLDIIDQEHMKLQQHG